MFNPDTLSNVIRNLPLFTTGFISRSLIVAAISDYQLHRSLVCLKMALSSHISSILYLQCQEFQCNILYTFNFTLISNKFHLFLPGASLRSYSVIYHINFLFLFSLKLENMTVMTLILLNSTQVKG